MANLYGSMQGGRTAGLVGHNEMAAQLATHDGLIRTFIEHNGDYQVYLADEKGENGLLLIQGNVNRKTVADAAGNTIQMAPLKGKLDPIVVRNRGKAYAEAKTNGKTPAPAQGGKAATPSRAKKNTKKKKSAPPEEEQAVKDVANLNEGDRIKIVECPSTPKATGDEGVIEKIKAKSAAGPQITVVTDHHGAVVVYPKQGDKIALLTEAKAEEAKASS